MIYRGSSVVLSQQHNLKSVVWKQRKLILFFRFCEYSGQKQATIPCQRQAEPNIPELFNRVLLNWTGSFFIQNGQTIPVRSMQTT